MHVSYLICVGGGFKVVIHARGGLLGADSHGVFVCEVRIHKGSGDRKGAGAGGGGLIVRVSYFFVAER